MPLLETIAAELPALDLLPRHLATLCELPARHVPEAEVWAYGSRVNGDAHEGSDLDLVPRNPADLTQQLPGLFALREALQDSRLPLLVEVHDWAQLPAGFHDGIERRHVVVEPDRAPALARADGAVAADAALPGATPSEPAPAQDWLRDEEEAAWAHFQPGR